ncbi:hypothetical protein QBC38DRAFT_484856 [Podospora fimiseda]|uniref:Uncharacterized protein n=1 Tax=Podospora fimiseda TaxID=252190 RepID=A0AAN7BK49_9PEZI|nr:hypothetical protein QBC38DRAFT_484856 [Podospora fimiseda]
MRFSRSHNPPLIIVIISLVFFPLSHLLSDAVLLEGWLFPLPLSTPSECDTTAHKSPNFYCSRFARLPALSRRIFRICKQGSC